MFGLKFFDFKAQDTYSLAKFTGIGQAHREFFDSLNFSKLLMAVLYLSQVLEALEAAMRFPQTPWGQTVKP